MPNTYETCEGQEQTKFDEITMLQIKHTTMKIESFVWVITCFLPRYFLQTYLLLRNTGGFIKWHRSQDKSLRNLRYRLGHLQKLKNK